jgi:eukaryotic-like serine/threonine-protein kinase
MTSDSAVPRQTGRQGTAATAPAPAIPSEPVADDPFIGRLIDGRYQVVGRLGSGGMGIVYKVQHLRMGKIAAMKVMHRDLASDKDVVKRFRREAEAVSRLTHPNTVQTFDFGTADGSLYLVMEHVRGEDLGAILKRDGPMRFSRAAPILLQVCGALGEAHELGIIHRDLKPENILVTRTKDGHDHAKVLDFGLAKLGEREELSEVTGRGEIIGTPYYMSPEQIRGEELDHRSDIYSLGAVMYRMLTGQAPFRASTPVGVLTKHLTDEPVPPSRARPELGIDARVDAVVLCALAKRREARWNDVDQLRGELELLGEELRDAAGDLPAAGRRLGTGGGLRPDSAPRSLVAPGSDIAHPASTPVRLERRGLGDISSGESRLAREDFDAFERSVRRGVWIRMGVAPLVVAVAAIGIWLYLRGQNPQPQREEVEPNDDREHATLIASGVPVRGRIGKRLAPDRGDRDYYYLVRAARGAAVGRAKLSARVTAIPNIDLALVVYDHAGRPLAIADAAGVGEPEVVPDLGVGDDRVYVAVLESTLTPPTVPTENLSDAYELTVTIGAASADEELEPNDVPSDATPIPVGAARRGTLGRGDDVDCWRFQGTEGKYDLELDGAEAVGAALRVRIDDGEERASRKERVELHPGSIVRVSRAPAPAPGPGQRPPTVAGVDDPYTLVIRPAR